MSLNFDEFNSVLEIFDKQSSMLQDQPYLWRKVEDKYEDTSDQEYLAKIVYKTLYKLEEEIRNIIILRDIQELSYDDISKIVEVPLGTVKSRINRGRIKLQELLEKKGARPYWMNCYDFELNISAYIDGGIKQKHRHHNYFC